MKVRVGISAVLKCRCRRVRSCSKSATQLHQPLRVEVDCLIMGLCFMVLGAHLESARISSPCAAHQLMIARQCDDRHV